MIISKITFSLAITMLFSKSYQSNNTTNKRVKRSFMSNMNIEIDKIGFDDTSYCITITYIGGSHFNSTFDQLCNYTDPFLDASNYCMVTLINLFWGLTSGYCAFCANAKAVQNVLNIPVKQVGKIGGMLDPYLVHFFAVHPDHNKSRTNCSDGSQMFGVDVGLIKVINAVEQQLNYSLLSLTTGSSFTSCKAATNTYESLDNWNKETPWQGKLSIDTSRFMSCAEIKNRTAGCFEPSMVCETIAITTHNVSEKGLKRMSLGSPMICGKEIAAVLSGTLKRVEENDTEVQFVWTKIKGKNYDWTVQVIDAFTRTDVPRNTTNMVDQNFKISKYIIVIVACLLNN